LERWRGHQVRCSATHQQKLNDLVTVALVFAGGAGGSALRWLVGVGVGERYKGTFPLGTFLINVSGAFLMGFLSTLFNVDWKDRYGSNLTALVLTGVLGGYTTFSSYQLRWPICTTEGGWHSTGLARWLQV
jgi:protein CrcB